MPYTAKDHIFVICAYKQSEFLENCILSLFNQTVKSKIIMVTSTPNTHIDSLSQKYDIPLFINEGEAGIGGDWNFGYSQNNHALVTIAHQDDIYEPEYTEQMLTSVNKTKNPLIYFSHYAELRGEDKVFKNKLLNTKKLLLSPLSITAFQSSKFIRRRILSLGNPICCPAVTYITAVLEKRPFTNNFKSNIDWEIWEILSRKKGNFVYCPKPLMCHRVHDGSTTSELINDNSRTQEDYEMYLKFWPKSIAKLLLKYYLKSQESNNEIRSKK